MKARALHAALLVTLCAVACGESDPGPPRPEEPLLQLPAPIGETAFGSHTGGSYPTLYWSADGSTIIYQAVIGPPFGLRALNLATGQTRSPWSEASSTGMGKYELTRNGAWMYFAHGTTGSYSIFRAPAAGGAAEPLVQGTTADFGISDDGRYLAWRHGTQDSAFLRDLATGATQPLPGVRTPVAVSPDGTMLLHGYPEINLMTLATGQSRLLVAASGQRLFEYRWMSGDVEVLASPAIGAIDLIRGSGSSVRILAGGPAFPAAATLSPDGRYVAVNYSCSFSVECIHQLRLVEVATGVSRLLTTSRDFFGMPRFSLTGDRLAVPTGGRLYIIPVP
jgi:hypothetical protein